MFLLCCVPRDLRLSGDEQVNGHTIFDGPWFLGDGRREFLDVLDAKGVTTLQRLPTNTEEL